MAKLARHQIREKAKTIIASNPGGVRYAALVQKIWNDDQETNKGSIEGAIWNLDTVFPDEIRKPERGLFVPANKSEDGLGGETGQQEQVTPSGTKVKESDFYVSFAEWLKEDLGEVNVAVPLGGAGLKSKWGTPDVVGAYKPQATDYVKFQIELVSAEIKIDPLAPIVAFGQAVADRLFFHQNLHRHAGHSDP